MFQYEMPCSQGDCDRLVGRKGARGMCSPCIQRARRAAFVPVACDVEGCAQPQRYPGVRYCDMHRARIRRTGELGSSEPLYIRGEGGLTKSGYIVIQRNGRRVPEHHWVVEETLGRQLHPFENVHHKNGVRHDNRPENLEIWIVPQPKGQRPEGLLAWCDENHSALTEAAAWNAP